MNNLEIEYLKTYCPINNIGHMTLKHFEIWLRSDKYCNVQKNYDEKTLQNIYILLSDYPELKKFQDHTLLILTNEKKNKFACKR